MPVYHYEKASIPGSMNENLVLAHSLQMLLFTHVLCTLRLQHTCRQLGHPHLLAVHQCWEGPHSTSLRNFCQDLCKLVLQTQVNVRQHYNYRLKVASLPGQLDPRFPPLSLAAGICMGQWGR